MAQLIKVYPSQGPFLKWRLSLLFFWNHVTFLFALTHSAGSLVVLTGLALIPRLGSPFPKAFHIARLGNVFFSGT